MGRRVAGILAGTLFLTVWTGLSPMGRAAGNPPETAVPGLEDAKAVPHGAPAAPPSAPTSGKRVSALLPPDIPGPRGFSAAVSTPPPAEKPPVCGNALPPTVSCSSVPSRLPAEPVLSLVAPPSGKAPDRVLSRDDVDLQVTRNQAADDNAEAGIGENFFANASDEVGKGKDGVFANLSSRIEQFIRYFQTRGRDKFERYLARSGKYGEMMRKILARYGLPEDLVYVALIESGFSPKAYSVARAAGPWQFIAGTGRRYGLRIDWWTDERRDAVKSTHAAASYLKDLYGMFDSWPLATAAYNAGEGKIQKAVARYNSDDFAVLIRHRYLKQETKDYVPKMLAALAIAKEPEKYGFGDVEYEEPLDLRTVEVPGGTDLAELSRILDVPYGTLREWNPELRRFCTPPNREQYELRLGTEAARRAEERAEEIRSQAKITFLQHGVRKGETLNGLAEKYRVPAANLKELNGLKRNSLYRVSRLVIPVTGLSADESVPGKEVSPDQLTMAHMRAEEGGRGRRHGRGHGPGTGRGGTITIRKGDTLGRLAKTHGVSVKALARANGIAPGAPLRIGSRLVLPGGRPSVRAASGAKKRGAPKPLARSRKRTVRYKVHKGDTLDKIARVYGVRAETLADRNRLKNGDLLRLGTVLVIPLES